LIEEIARGKFYGFNRFLRESKQITPAMLSTQLKELEKADLIKKVHRNHSNRKVTSYTLTQKGTELYKVIIEMKKWGIKCGNAPDFCLHTACIECPKYIS